MWAEIVENKVMGNKQRTATHWGAATLPKNWLW
jgi:hypothetical protein